MADILKSIIGRLLGLDGNGYLTGADDTQAPDFSGLLIGQRGRGFMVTSPRYAQTIADDFMGSVISAVNWTVGKGSDGGTVNFATLAAQAGGVVRATTGAGATTTMAVNGVQIVGGRNFLVSGGGMYVEARIQPSAITNLNLFVGFSDTTVGTLQAPFTISSAVVTANATNAVGFVFDTGATASTTKLVSDLTSGTAQLVDTGLAPDTAAFHRYRVDLDASGNASFFIDGAQVGAKVSGKAYNIAAAVATTAIMAPKVEAFSLAASSINVDLDYLVAQQRLATAR